MGVGRPCLPVCNDMVTPWAVLIVDLRNDISVILRSDVQAHNYRLNGSRAVWRGQVIKCFALMSCFPRSSLLAWESQSAILCLLKPYHGPVLGRALHNRSSLLFNKTQYVMLEVEVKSGTSSGQLGHDTTLLTSQTKVIPWHLRWSGAMKKNAWCWLLTEQK